MDRAISELRRMGSSGASEVVESLVESLVKEVVDVIESVPEEQRRRSTPTPNTHTRTRGPKSTHKPPTMERKLCHWRDALKGGAIGAMLPYRGRAMMKFCSLF